MTHSVRASVPARNPVESTDESQTKISGLPKRFHPLAHLTLERQLLRQKGGENGTRLAQPRVPFKASHGRHPSSMVLNRPDGPKGLVPQQLGPRRKRFLAHGIVSLLRFLVKSSPSVCLLVQGNAPRIILSKQL